MKRACGELTTTLISAGLPGTKRNAGKTLIKILSEEINFCNNFK